MSLSGRWVGAGFGVVLLAACPMEPTAPDTLPTQEALVERGAYLAYIGGCRDCHTPRDQAGAPIEELRYTGHPADAPLPEWDPSLLERNILATVSPTGTAHAGPFGVSVAGNLTPDEETGTGRLTAEALIESWRTGQSWKHDRRIMPPMPVPSEMAEEDIRAIHAYLMSLQPVRNQAPSSQPAPPPEARRGEEESG